MFQGEVQTLVLQRAQGQAFSTRSWKRSVRVMGEDDLSLLWP